jgi:hypothetical protein
MDWAITVPSTARRDVSEPEASARFAIKSLLFSRRMRNVACGAGQVGGREARLCK